MIVRFLYFLLSSDLGGWGGMGDEGVSEGEGRRGSGVMALQESQKH